MKTNILTFGNDRIGYMKIDATNPDKYEKAKLIWNMTYHYVRGELDTDVAKIIPIAQKTLGITYDEANILVKDARTKALNSK
jgi:hypothetical protein